MLSLTFSHLRNIAIIGVDAHYPDLLNDTDAIELCKTVAANYDVLLIDYLPGLEPQNIN